MLFPWRPLPFIDKFISIMQEWFMSKNVEKQRDAILTAMLPHVPFDGWTLDLARRAATETGAQTELITALFPDGLPDIVAHFSDLMDRQMRAALSKTKIEDLRVRDRIEAAVWARLAALEPHKDAMRLALAYWSVPPRSLRAGQIVWRTADRIWQWAGDTATDYNRYTKRTLLSGILTTTLLVWIKDTSENHQNTHDFLTRRIDNVLQIGQIMGRFKSKG